MKKITFMVFALYFSCIVSNVWAQGVAINTTGLPADNSAMLDIESTTKGVLISRMTEAQRNAISSPATGLMVFVTDDNNLYYWDGSAWVQFSAGSGSCGYYVGGLIGTNGVDGVVFWVDHTGQHGLICSKTDIDGGSGVQWYNGSNTITGATSDYDGASNTTTIIVSQGAGTYAAKLCEDYSTTGTSAGDWYLPSIDELSKIYHTKYEINKALNTNSFEVAYYWSSTEYTISTAWVYKFYIGTSYSYGKNTAYRVRAVRAY